MSSVERYFERYCGWLAKRFPRWKNDFGNLKSVLSNEAYTLEALRKEKDEILGDLIGKRGLVILLKKHVRDFAQEEKSGN